MYITHLLLLSTCFTLMVGYSHAVVCSGTSTSGSAAYASTVTDDDITSRLRLPDSARGTIQIMAPFSDSVLQRPGIAATLAAIQQAEEENLLPFYVVNVTAFSYPDITSDYYAMTEAISKAILGDIVNNTGNSETFPYSAVMALDFDIADYVIPVLAATTNTSRIPIINPLTANGLYYTSAFSNILHYKPDFVSELLQMIRFAFTNLNCANSDVHTQLANDISGFITLINVAFSLAGFPNPAVINTPESGLPNATANQKFIDQVLTDGMENRNVQCVFVIDIFRRDLHELILTDPRGAKFFKRTALLHFSTGANTIPVMNSSQGAIYDLAYFTSTEPNIEGTSKLTAKYKAALSAFNANHTEADHKRMNAGIITNTSAVGGYYPGDATTPTPFGFQTYTATRWLLELLAQTSPSPRSLIRSKMAKKGVCNITELNITDEFSSSDYPLLAPDSEDIITAAFNSRVLIAEDFSVGPLMPAQCLLSYRTNASTCYCNVGGKMLFMSKYSQEKLELESFVATNEFGSAIDVTTIVPARQCSLEVKDIFSSLPSTLMFIDNGDPTSIFTQIAPMMFAGIADFANSISTSISDSSVSTTIRYANVNATGLTEYETQEAFAEAVNSTSPFILLGSGSALSFLDETSSKEAINGTLTSGNYEAIANNISVTPTTSILSFVNGIDHYALEDPVLVSPDLWNPAHVNLRATFADHTHTIAAYYTNLLSGSSPPTSLSAIVETTEQAALVAKSFTTFQTSVGVATLSNIGGTVSAFRSWLAAAVDGGGSRPFIFVGLMTNTSLALELLHIINGTEGVAATSPKTGLRFGVASPEETMFDLFEFTTPNALLEMMYGFRSDGFQVDMFIEAAPIANFNVSSLYVRSNPLTIDTSNQDAPDIVFASHLNGWYLPRSTGAIVHPAAFRRLEVVRTALSILTGMSTVASTTAADILYELINVGGITTSYGPFYKTACSAAVVASNNRVRNCQCAKGPRTFQTISFLNYYLLQTSTRTNKFTYLNEGCGVVYHETTDSSSFSLSSSDIAGIAVGCAFVVGIILGLCVCFYCCRRTFSVRHAPKDSSLPFAMAFTDIQSSTTLWARVPEAMASSVDAHHELLRDCVSVYNGYEVKTIGDSFMVAFKTADAAAKFALGVQIKLFNYHLWGPEIDETYIETLLDAHRREQDNAESSVDFINNVAVDQAINALMANEGKEGQPGSPIATESPQMLRRRHSKKQLAAASVYLPLDPATGELDHDIYDRLWCGLRVRVGIHYGCGEIKRDPVSDRFDYYGTVVNTAARVEGVGHGGQVLLTDDAFQALTPGFEKTFNVAVDELGPQPLRGLDAPVVLYQLTPLSLFERTFPPLRLDIEKVADEIHTEDDSDDDSNSNSNSTSNASSMGVNQTITAFGIYRKKFLSVVSPWSPEATADKITAKEMKVMMIGNKGDRRAPDSKTVSIEGSVRGDDHAFISPLNPVFSPQSNEHPRQTSSVWDRDPEAEPVSFQTYYETEETNIKEPESHDPQLIIDATQPTNTLSSPLSPMANPTPTTAKTVRSNKDKDPFAGLADAQQQQLDMWIQRHEAARSKVLSFFYFMETALATSSPAHRAESISQMSKKWQIKVKSPSGKLREKLAKRGLGSRRASEASQKSRYTDTTSIAGKRRAAEPTLKAQNDAYDQMYLLMSLCAKVGKAATVRQAQKSRKIAN